MPKLHDDDYDEKKLQESPFCEFMESDFYHLACARNGAIDTRCNVCAGLVTVYFECICFSHEKKRLELIGAVCAILYTECCHTL